MTSLNHPIGFVNWPVPTLGGKQFWTDVEYFAGWRIQQNTETGHYRLLDPKQIRHAWGNRLHCQMRLSRIREERELKPHVGKVVILLHGLSRTRNSLKHLARTLNDVGLYQVIPFEYASCRGTIEQHAKNLHSMIQHLGIAVEEINFVCHSLGNLIVRRYLHDHPMAGSGSSGYPKIGRMAMLAPPNHGSKMAAIMRYTGIFQVITGASGHALSIDWPSYSKTLAIPKFEFAILAGTGSRKLKWLNNPLLSETSDLTVTLNETKLTGAADYKCFPVYHWSMLYNRQVIDAVVRFLQHGYLVTAGEKTTL
ncbi:MAG TPA: hypothetical protein PKD64_01205 [Pirellulaceae bacterium]|nr:hypothetical protein [Pirellulaceae bacterium]HMO90788.1 hypothetical protein [Pirellulaceae bacterium]HMP68039.1 hypothetical protein [Pirellulaceae bacterium]